MEGGFVGPVVRRVVAWALGRELRATIFYCVLATLVAWHGLLGGGTIGPDAELDRDPLFLVKDDTVPQTADLTPIVLDQPRDLLFARGLHAGRFDTWNPLASCGAPLWAEQGGPFPLKLPYYLWPDIRAYNWFRALRLVVAGLGAYLLARRRGISEGAALVAGALFEISGPLIGQAPFATTSATCLLPWAVSAADALAREGTRAAIVRCALVLGLAGWGGHPEINVLVYLGFGTAVLGYAITEPSTAARLLLRSSSSAVLGLALAAPSLLPLGEIIREGQSYKSAAMGERIWRDDLRFYTDSLPSALFAPNALISVRDTLGGRFPFTFPSIGLGGLVLAMVGVSVGDAGAPLVSCALLGVGLATAPPGMAWLHDLPVLKFILPHYAWPLVALPLTQWAGTGMQTLADRRGPVRMLMALLICTAVAAILWVHPPAAGTKAALSTVGKLALRTHEGHFRLFGPPGAVLLSAVVSFLSVRRRPHLGMLIASATAVCEPALSMSSYVSAAASRALSRPPTHAAAFLQDRLAAGSARMLGLPFRMGMPNSPFLYGLADFRSTSAVPLRRFILYKELIDPTPSGPTYHSVGVAASPLLDLAAVRYVVTGRYFRSELLDKDPQEELAYSDAGIRILENHAAVPRVWVAHRASLVDSDRGARDALRRKLRGATGKHATEAGLLDLVYLEPSRDGHEPIQLQGPPWTKDDLATIGHEPDPDRVRLDVDLTTAGYVVLADAYYPGWKATVDGKETPIYPADVLFRAVLVPAGRHTVQFRYASPALRLGLAIAAAALVACALQLHFASSRRPQMAKHRA